MEGLPWTPIHFTSKSTLLDFGFDTDTGTRMGMSIERRIDGRDDLTHPWGK